MRAFVLAGRHLSPMPNRWRDLATAASLRHSRALQLGRARRGAAQRQLRQAVWGAWVARYSLRRAAWARVRAVRRRLLHAAFAGWRGWVAQCRREAAVWRDVAAFDCRQRMADAMCHWRLWVAAEVRQTRTQQCDYPAGDVAREVLTVAEEGLAGLARCSVPRLAERTRGVNFTPATPRNEFNHGRFPVPEGQTVVTAVGSCVGQGDARAVIARFSTPRAAVPPPRQFDDDESVREALFA